ALVVLRRVRLTEAVEVVEPLARARRPGGGGAAAVGPVARFLARLEVQDVRLRSLLLRLGRLDADVGEPGLVLKRGAHAPKCRHELVTIKERSCPKVRLRRTFAQNSSRPSRRSGWS